MAIVSKYIKMLLFCKFQFHPYIAYYINLQYRDFFSPNSIGIFFTLKWSSKNLDWGCCNRGPNANFLKISYLNSTDSIPKISYPNVRSLQPIVSPARVANFFPGVLLLQTKYIFALGMIHRQTDDAMWLFRTLLRHNGI